MNIVKMQEIVKDRSKVEAGTGCWIWQRGKAGGYGQIRTKDRLYGAHRASYEAFRGPIPKGMCVCHICDVRACVNPDHFFIGTRADNNKDAQIKGIYKRAVKKPRPSGLVYKRPLSYLDEQILTLISSGESISKIARDLGINRRTVRRAASANAA